MSPHRIGRLESTAQLADAVKHGGVGDAVTDAEYEASDDLGAHLLGEQHATPQRFLEPAHERRLGLSVQVDGTRDLDLDRGGLDSNT